MSIFPLLDLPVELTERILLSADVPTVLRVMQTARLIYAFIYDSEGIQYKIQLYYHGYVDAPRAATSSFAVRRVQLAEFRHRWITTESTRDGRLRLSSMLYILEGGVSAMLDRSSNLFLITCNQGPSRGITPLSWKTPSLDFKILTFGMDPTVNLLAVFGITETDTNCAAQIHLLTLTNCTTSPLAVSPVLGYPGLPNWRYIQDSWSKILISGPWLGLAWREVSDSDWERLFIWNWKSGNGHLYLERVLAFSFISDKYLITAHQEYLSVYDLSKEYPLFSRLDPYTAPAPVYQLVLPEICHAAGLHRSGSLDHVPGSPVPLPSDATDTLPVPNFPPEKGISSDSYDGEPAREGKEVPFYEDPSRNILAVNLISHVGYWPRAAGTIGTTIIIPLQRLVDLAEETVTESTADVVRKVTTHPQAPAEAQGKAEVQMYSELDGVQPLGIPHHYQIFELARAERQRRVELIKAGPSATVSNSIQPLRKPRRFQPAEWLNRALAFKQNTHGRPYDYRKSIVSGSRFVSPIEVREGKRLFQLIEFNPTWVNALERRLARPARNVGVHYMAAHGHPVFHLVEQNWRTEGLIVPITFGQQPMVANDVPLPSPTPILPSIPSPSLTELETVLRHAETDFADRSWYGWRVARCGEVKYAWKVIQAGGNIIALDVAIQEDSLIYTAIEDGSPGAHVYLAISSF